MTKEGGVQKEDEGEYEVLVVELNSLESWTGACLFSWSKDFDRFLNGPFECRIVTEPTNENFVGILPRNWEQAIDRRWES